MTLGLLLVVAFGSFCASLLNAASNVLNQITDLEVDRVNKPDRPLVTGEASVASAWRLAAWLYALALVPVWWIVVPSTGGFLERALAPLPRHQCFFLFLGGFLATLVYSVPAFGRTKRFGIWANVTIALPRGCWLKVAGWTLVASAGCWEPWAIGTLFMLFLVGASSTKDFSDVPGDRAGGCRTLPVLYGNRKAVAIIAPFFVLPWILLALAVLLPDPAAARAAAPHRKPRAPRRPRAAPRRVGELHRLAPGAESGRAVDHREPPVVDPHVPDADDGAGRIRGRVRRPLSDPT